METKQIQLFLDRFKEFITKEVDTDVVFEILDEVMFEYASYVLKDTGICGGSETESTNLYFLKVLRDLFKQPKTDQL